MTLKDWLETRWKGSKEAFAKQVGISLMSLNRYERGIRQPRLDIAIRIEKATGGEVKVEDLIPRKPAVIR